MPFDPIGFLATARSLDKDHPDEAALRTCSGRAYYAAYLVARERLKALGFVRPSHEEGSAHSWLIGKLKRSVDRDVRALGRSLLGLFDERKDADYDLDRQAYAPGGGHLAAVRAEQWIREFRRIPDARLTDGLR